MPNHSVSPARLDSEQKQFLETCLFSGKNYWVSGFPGSGKSTLLEHCIRIIKADRPKAKILVVVFTRSLIEMFQAAFSEMGIKSIEVKTMYEFIWNPSHYDFILCDEVQDFTPRIIDGLHSYSKYLIVAGDENQSIYERDPWYREQTIDPKQISGRINGDSYPLTIVHRLSPAIQKAVQQLIPSLGNLAQLRNMADHQTQIRLCYAISYEEELKYIWKESIKAPQIGKTSVVLFPNHESIMKFVESITKLEKKSLWTPVMGKYGLDFDNMNAYLRSQGIKLQYVGNKFGDLKVTDTVYVMTYFSAKGLDFDNVFLPGINDRLFITASSELSKRIFMVAMTRSRNMLFVCYHGTPHPYTACFSSSCARINISDILNPTASSGVSFGNGISNSPTDTSGTIKIGF